MKTRGFTLIELLVVIAIIGVLSSVVLASLGTARAKAKNANRLATVKQIENALALYASTNGAYPPPVTTSECGGTEGYTVANNDFLAPLVTAGYLPTYPVDAGGVNCGLQYVSYSPYSTYYLFYDLEGQDAPSGGCNQPPTWYCKQP